MKRLSLILALILCFALVFASCGEAVPELSSSDSETEVTSVQNHESTSEKRQNTESVSKPETSSQEASTEETSVIDPSTYPRVDVYGTFSNDVAISPEKAVEIVKSNLNVADTAKYSFDVECQTTADRKYYHIRAYLTQWLEDEQMMMGYTMGWYYVDAVSGEIKKELP